MKRVTGVDCITLLQMEDTRHIKAVKMHSKKLIVKRKEIMFVILNRLLLPEAALMIAETIPKI